MDDTQITPASQPAPVPVTVSNEQTTFTTNVPLEVPTASAVLPGTSPISIPVTVSNDQTTITDVVEVTPTSLPSGVLDLPTSAPLMFSNDQTTLSTNVPIVIPTSLEDPGTPPTAVPVTISNDQITFTTDVSFVAPDTTVVPLPTQQQVQVTISNDATTLTTSGLLLTDSGTPLPTASPDNVFSTVVTPSNGQVIASTGVAGSGDSSPIIIMPTTKATGGETSIPLVTGSATITGTTPGNPVPTSTGIVVGPSTVITPTSGGFGTATPTDLGGISQTLGEATPTAGPNFSATGTSATNPLQSGVPSSLSQTVGPGQTQITAGGATNTGTIADSATSDGSGTSAGATLAGDSATSSSRQFATTGSEEATTAPAIPPQYTTTGKTSSVTYGATPGAPQTIQPIGSDTSTAISIPTSLVHAPSASQPTQTSEFIPVTLPSSVPPLIQPPGGMPPQPDDTTRIQVGFLQALNYAFVVNSEVTQEQIFDFLPPGIAYGLDIPVENVTMETLKADDTSTDLPYIRTLALAFIPKDQVNNLYLNLHTPAHRIYHNPNASIFQLMSFIDPSVAIQADNPMSGSSGPGGSGSGASPTPTNPARGGAPIGGGIGNDMPVRKSSVAIGVGVVCGAAAYGAAMFFIARRYKMRRQSHGRSPSMFSSPVYSGSHHDFMGGANAALMSGARGDGGRSATPPFDGYGYGRESRGSGRSGSTGRQQISAPVMAENSLGWN